MRPLNYVLICFVLALYACNGIDAPKKPKNLISKAKMSDILEDVYILNAAKGTNRKILEENGVDPEKYIYQKYGIDSIQFAESNEYYAFDVKAYEEIVDTVRARLEISKEIYNDQMTIKETSTSEEDSLRRRRDAVRKPVQLHEKLLEKRRQDSIRKDSLRTKTEIPDLKDIDRQP